RLVRELNTLFDQSYRDASGEMSAANQEKAGQLGSPSYKRAAESFTRARSAYSDGRRIEAIRAARSSQQLFHESIAEAGKIRRETRLKDEGDVRKLLRDYQSAYEKQDATSVARMQGQDGIAETLKKSWAGRRNVNVEFQEVAATTFADDGQSAKAVWDRIESFTEVGGRTTVRTRMTFNFAKNAEAWRIQSFSAQGVR